MRTEDIVNKVFTRSFMGYDIEEVDRFLDELIDQLECMEAEKQEMLIAMEYLLGKLEKGKKLPEREMRRAIAGGAKEETGDGKPARKKKRQPRTEADVRHEPEKTETKPAARSISRGTGNGAAKPVRAPKVKRVAKGAPGEAPAASRQETPAVQKQETSPKQGDDWLDELLGSLSERDRQGYRPPQEPSAEADAAEAQAETPAPKQEPEMRPEREPAFKPESQAEEPVKPKPEPRHEPETQPEREPVFKPEPEDETPVKPEPETRREPETQYKPEAQPEPVSEPQAAPETGTSAAPETNAGTDETAPDGEAREQ